MEAPGQERPGYFYLAELAAPAPQRTVTAALTHPTKSTTRKALNAVSQETSCESLESRL
jgi:hypothetical protein